MSGIRPVTSTDLVTSDAVTATHKGAVTSAENLTPRERLMRIAGSNMLTVIVILIAFVWLLPTIGILVTSLRPAQAVQSSGWWTALVPPWQFTLANYQHVLTAQGIAAAFKSSLIIAIPERFYRCWWHPLPPMPSPGCAFPGVIGFISSSWRCLSYPSR